MRTALGLALGLTLVAGLYLASLGEDASTDIVSVTRVVDGDTLIGQYKGSEVRIRLIGIDAPEVGQCYATSAAHMLSRLTLNKTVRGYEDQKSDDLYGRTLLYLYLEDGRFINQELVERGAAIATPVAPNTTHAGALYKAQVRAEWLQQGQHRTC